MILMRIWFARLHMKQLWSLVHISVGVANCCFCCWQLRKDSGNVEANEHLGQLQPVQENMRQARMMIDGHQYDHAVQMLAYPIEVWHSCEQRQVQYER